MPANEERRPLATDGDSNPSYEHITTTVPRGMPNHRVTRPTTTARVPQVWGVVELDLSHLDRWVDPGPVRAALSVIETCPPGVAVRLQVGGVVPIAGMFDGLRLGHVAYEVTGASPDLVHLWVTTLREMLP